MVKSESWLLGLCISTLTLISICIMCVTSFWPMYTHKEEFGLRGECNQDMFQLARDYLFCIANTNINYILLQEYAVCFLKF